MIQIEYEDRPVGRAIVESDRLALEYDGSWLAEDDAFALTVNLPLRAERWPAAQAHPFFANLLPEGLAREAICRRLGISVDNDVALLSALGDDTAGAFRFVPDDEERPPVPRRDIPLSDLESWSRGAPHYLPTSASARASRSPVRSTRRAPSRPRTASRSPRPTRRAHTS